MNMMTAQELGGKASPPPAEPSKDATTAAEPTQEPAAEPDRPAAKPKGPYNERIAQKHPWLNFNDIPEQQRPVWKERFRDIYDTMKVSKQESESLRTRVVELESVLRKQAAEREKQGATAEIATIEADIAKALKKANYEEVARLQTKLTAAQVKATAPRKNDAADDRRGFSQGDLDEIYGWAAEITEDGRYARPWAHKGHPMHAEVTRLLNDLHSRYPNSTTRQILRGADYLIADHLAKGSTKQQTGKQEGRGEFVMNSDGTPLRQNGRQRELSEREKVTAQKQFPDMPPAKAYERYRNGLKRAGRLP